ncbi:unnamed protein product, partial [Thlaspi arvense]
MANDGATTVDHHLGEIKRSGDSISFLPDEILQHILSLIPTKSVITTSVLSKRWRHVWFNTPSLSFDSNTVSADTINQTLAQYTARKMETFQLCSSVTDNLPHIDRWVEFATSRNVENLTLDLDFRSYNIPDFFYTVSSVKQLSLELHSSPMIPKSSVSWTSLKKLSLRSCKLSDESAARILSGCPIIESLTLHLCDQLRVLDLSKSQRLRTLKIDGILGPIQIVAPHIHYLSLTNFRLSCTLVDVSSLTEAKLNINVGFCPFEELKATLQEMLEKVHNVDKLTFGKKLSSVYMLNAQQMYWLSLVVKVQRGATFPGIKVKDLTLETRISPHVVPGINRLLQGSPELKKLTVHVTESGTVPLPKKISDIVYRKHVNYFMEQILKKHEDIGEDDCKGLEELLCQMVPVLSHKHNVSIVLSSIKPDPFEPGAGTASSRTTRVNLRQKKPPGKVPKRLWTTVRGRTSS